MKIYFSAFLLSIGLLAFPARAEAKVPIIYHSGEEIFATGPLPPPWDQDKELSGYQAGYLCQIKGVLWSYFSVSDCKPVAFQGENYMDEPEIVAAITAKYSEKDMQRGVWNRFGWMLIAGAAAVGILIWLKEKITGR